MQSNFWLIYDGEKYFLQNMIFQKKSKNNEQCINTN